MFWEGLFPSQKHRHFYLQEYGEEMIQLYIQATIYFALTVSYFFTRVSVEKRKQKVEVDM